MLGSNPFLKIKYDARYKYTETPMILFNHSVNDKVIIHYLQCWYCVICMSIIQ